MSNAHLIFNYFIGLSKEMLISGGRITIYKMKFIVFMSLVFLNCPLEKLYFIDGKKKNQK